MLSIIIEQKLPLSEFLLPYLPISINCPPPRMAGLSIAGEAELKVPHTDTPYEAFSWCPILFSIPLTTVFRYADLKSEEILFL